MAGSMRHADGMRPHAEHRLQMLCVHQKAYKVVFIKIEAEQHPAAHVVDARLHGTVE